MAFAFIVCALILLTIGYFAVLVTGEIALWLVSRFAQIERRPLTVLIPRR